LLTRSVGYHQDGAVSEPTEAVIATGAPSSRVTTAHLCDVSPFGILMDRGIRAVWAGANAEGRAFTVRTPPGDNASLMVALREAEAGDVLVVDSGGVLDRALWGAILSLAASNRGIRGLVIDGAVRDVDEIAEMRFPIFARGITPDTPYSKVHGSTGQPIVCGGLAVRTGDAVYADGDGVVVIASEVHEATLERARHRMSLEDEIFRGLAGGRPLDELVPILAQTRRS
jgi:4-hydroxy-4-methyl-2-oxoglutarate aldolase